MNSSVKPNINFLFIKRRFINSSYIERSGINLTDDEIRFIVWTCADGSITPYGSINFHFRKQRKIDEVINLNSLCIRGYGIINEIPGIWNPSYTPCIFILDNTVEKESKKKNFYIYFFIYIFFLYIFFFYFSILHL